MNTHKITRVMAVGALSLGTITAGAATATNASADAAKNGSVIQTSAFTTQDGKVSCGWDKRSKQVLCFNSTKSWGGDNIVTTFASVKVPNAPIAPTQGPEFDSARQQPTFRDGVPTKHVRIATDKGDYVDQDFVVLDAGTKVTFPNGQTMTLDRDGAHGTGSNGHPWTVSSGDITN